MRIWVEPRGKWRSVLLAVVIGVSASVLAVGLSPGIASAGYSPTTGYFPFEPQAFGDAASCQILASSFGTGFDALFANQPVVGIAVTPGCTGGWLATADGGVFSSQGVPFYGSAGNLHLNQPIVGMAATPDGKGYWLVAADGGILSYGDAQFYGSMGGKSLDAPIVGMASTRDGDGYWLVAADGGIFTFGNAAFDGSTGGAHLVAPVTGMAATPDDGGYWLVAADGGVFAFGDAGFYGSLSSEAGSPGGSEGSDVIANPIIALVSSPSGRGYLLLPTTPAVNPTKPDDTGYALARREWQISPYEAAVYQSITWLQAASYLRIGEGVDPGNTSGYPVAIRDLDQLASIPEMDVTPAQDAEGSADGAFLTPFFNALGP